MTSARRLADLPPAQRYQAVGIAALRFVLTFAAVIALYFVLPLEHRSSDLGRVISIVLAVLVVLAIMIWQIRQILSSTFPALRAIQAVAIALPLFLTTFAAGYVLLSRANPANFNQPIDRTAGLYFAVVVFGTVGFGDIAPASDAARLVVGAQILLDIAFLALVVRAFFAASRLSLQRSTPNTPTAPKPGDDRLIERPPDQDEPDGHGSSPDAGG